MKKLSTAAPDNENRYLKKTILIMKLTTLLLFVNFLQLSAISFSQEERFTIKGEKIQIRDLLDQLESESDYKFLYRSEYVVDKMVSLDAESLSLEDLLTLAFNNSDITYQMLNDKLIVIAPKSFSPVVQELNITGKVTDANTGEPLPGVYIVIENTNQGVVSDAEGKFSISVPGSETYLMFSFVGYVTERIQVGTATSLNIALVPDIKRLDEVVVIGYGTVKKKDLTGAVASLQSKDLGNSSVANVGQMIQGKVAGVEIAAGENGGRPGGGMNIKIRGTTSINETAPLAIIDGMVGDVDMVAPSEIESIDILKDASAAAIYGSKGANGVIIITTKKGKLGKPHINYEGYYGVTKPGNKLDILKASDYIDLVYDIQGGAYNASTGHWDKPAGMPGVFDDENYVRTDRVNMQDELFRNATVQSHNLDLNGGTDNLKYRFAAGYFDQGSTRGNFNYTRYNLKANIEGKIGKHITLGNNTLFRHIIETGLEGDVMGALRWAPYVGVFGYDPLNLHNQGNYSYIANEVNLNDSVNPMAFLEFDNHRNRDWKLLSQLYAEVMILKGLNFHSRFQYEFGTKYFMDYREKDYMNSIQQTNYLEEGYTISAYPKFENFLTYDKIFGQHSFSLLGGINYERGNYERNLSAKGTNYGGSYIPIKKVTVGGDPASISAEGVTEDASMSYFGRVNYSFMDRYLVTANFRADASMRFAPSNRWGYFPSLALAWKLKEESFLKEVAWLTSLKLRVGWGKAGNDEIDQYLYSSNIYLGGYGGGDPYIVYPLGIDNTLASAIYGATVNAIPSPTIRWEETITKGLGFDASFLSDRIYLTLDYYHKYTDGILISVPVPLSTGITNPQTKNAAEVINKGVEMEMGYRGNSAFGLKYNFTLVAAYNRNKVKSLGEGQPVYGANTSEVGYLTRTATGFPIGYYYGYKTDGLLYTAEDAAAYNSKYGTTAEAGDLKFKDLNLDGQITDADRTNLGNAMPKWTYGLNLNFEYRGIDLRMVLSGVWGCQLVNWNGVYWLEGGVRPFNGSTDLLKRWKYDGDMGAELPRVEKTDPNKNTRFSDRYVEDGSYARMKTLTLGYTIKNKWVNSVASSFRIYATLENILTFTKYTGYDPDFGGGKNTERGIDYTGIPLPKNYLFGVQVSF
jgi:TonB-dependent starch-binding outer membrane protein SusC